MTELILIRHGETDWNRELRFQGHIDAPLNATGQIQAARLAARLADETIDHLVCSDLLRTRQTAAPTARQFAPTLPAGPELDAALREQHFGIYEGLTAADAQREHAEAWTAWSQFHPDYALPGGESAVQFHARTVGALRRIAAAHAGRTVAVVTHGGVLDMVWRTAHGLGLHGPRRSQIPNAGYNRVRFADPGAGGAIEVLAWADARHLDGLPAQPVYGQIRHADADPPPRPPR